jgi:hypothetical protein
MTSAAGRPNTYDFYVAGRQLFVAPTILKQFPELHGLVDAFGMKPGFRSTELLHSLQLTDSRTASLLTVLEEHHVVLKTRTGAYVWNEVELNKVLPIVVADDFVS